LPVPREQLESAIKRCEGEILQRPPAFSAMKIDGRRAYDLARRGHEVKLEPRPVRIYRIELLDFQWPLGRLRIECGRGTYIRALARDLGETLSCGGYLTELVRTRVGQFSLANSVSLDQLKASPIEPFLQPLSQISQL
jgi:tRNA pseudouridine55 synthase